jgi:hypothetical protein
MLLFSLDYNRLIYVNHTGVIAVIAVAISLLGDFGEVDNAIPETVTRRVTAWIQRQDSGKIVVLISCIAYCYHPMSVVLIKAETKDDRIIMVYPILCHAYDVMAIVFSEDLCVCILRIVVVDDALDFIRV